MKKFEWSFITIVMLLLMAIGPVQAQQDEVTFLEGFSDVPLLTGFQEVEGKSLVYDTPAGTIAQTMLAAQKSTKQAMQLYQDSLQAFGWKCLGDQAHLLCKKSGYIMNIKPQKYGQKSMGLMLKSSPIKAQKK